MKTPSYQTIVLRLAYMPDDQQDKPADWRWPVLLECATNEVTASSTLTTVLIQDDEGFNIMDPLLFSSNDLALEYLTAWFTRHRDEMSVDDSQEPLKFESLAHVKSYAIHQHDIAVLICELTIDPVYGE